MVGERVRGEGGDYMLHVHVYMIIAIVIIE
jgi:hypothetical protein